MAPSATMMSTSVASPDALNSQRMRALSAEEYDSLSFGVIELDPGFVVRNYNARESQLARRSAADTIGRHFFHEVAPCADVPEFRGRLESLMSTEAGADSELRFDYHFAFAWGRRRVRIRALRGDDGCWIFVTPLKSLDRD